MIGNSSKYCLGNRGGMSRESQCWVGYWVHKLKPELRTCLLGLSYADWWNPIHLFSYIKRHRSIGCQVINWAAICRACAPIRLRVHTENGTVYINNFVMLALERVEFLWVGFVEACRPIPGMSDRANTRTTTIGQSFLRYLYHFGSAYKSCVGEYYIYHISLYHIRLYKTKC